MTPRDEALVDHRQATRQPEPLPGDFGHASRRHHPARLPPVVPNAENGSMPADRSPAPPHAARRGGGGSGRGRARRLATAGLAVLVTLGAAGCVGKTGRNDDYVEPGSQERGPSGQVVPADG
jgi:hypothetical protein